jgi:hypothetical protein
MRPLKQLLLPALFFFVGISAAFAQAKPVQSDELKKFADGKSFLFKAQYANLSGNDVTLNASFVNNTAQAGNTHIYLKGDYTVVVKPDSVSSFLPYFGNTTSDEKPNEATSFTTLTINDNPGKFMSPKYNYVVKQKKTSVQITITPPKTTQEDNKQVEKYVFEIGADGRVKLTISIAGDKTITYDGIIAG